MPLTSRTKPMIRHPGGRLAFAVFTLCAACSPSSDAGTAGEKALRAIAVTFPEHGQSIAAGAWSFEPIEREAIGLWAPLSQGLSVARSDREPGAVDAVLPGRGEDGVVFSLPDGFTLKVHESGMAGPAVLTDGAVTYEQTRGTSVWRPVGAGIEEWLYLPKGSPSAEVARWRVEGGELRQHGWAVDVYNSEGRARVTVSAPEAWNASGEQVAVRLTARGDEITLLVDEPTREPLLVDPVWISAGSMAVARHRHTASLLPSGRVLVVGGAQEINNTTVPLNSVEIYDPATGTWTPTTSVADPCYGHAAATLNDGTVFVVGATYGIKPAKLYDEPTGAWASTSMPLGFRIGHTATELQDGRILVVGYSSTVPTEVYDPQTDTWAADTPLPDNSYRSFHEAVRLPDGRVLVAGGFLGFPLSTAHLYVPQSHSWTQAASMQSTRAYFASALLPSGNVLAVGGFGYLGTGEIYDPVLNTWQPTGSLTTGRALHRATLLASGHVLVTAGSGGGGSTQKTTELFDSATNGWMAQASLLAARDNHTATLLANDRVLVAGGRNQALKELSSAEVYTGNLSMGAPCQVDAQCSSAYCVDSVCCDSVCAAGPCDACSMATGAQADGICTVLSGLACDDGDSCTQADTCAAGVCSGVAIDCPDGSECEMPGVCDSSTGSCTYAPQPDGTPCLDGLCSAGACVAGSGEGGTGGTGGNSDGGGGAGGRQGEGGAGGQSNLGGGGIGGSGGVALPGPSGSGGSGAVGAGPDPQRIDAGGCQCEATPVRGSSNAGLFWACAALLGFRIRLKHGRGGRSPSTIRSQQSVNQP